MKVILVLLACGIILLFAVFQGNQPVALEHESGPEPRIYFCHEVNCTAAFRQEFAGSGKLDCAFFELDDPLIIQTLRDKDARIVSDSRKKVEFPDVVYDNRAPYMHNKFCIDENGRVWTGSWNPTVSANDDRNNVVVFDSRLLAEKYGREFRELHSGTFGAGDPTEGSSFMFNEQHVKVHFCPEDRCSQEVLEEITGAQESIHFMMFSFTNRELAQALITKSQQGVLVRGLYEPTLRKSGNYDSLQQEGLEVRMDGQKGFLHHKVFVIDGRTVITGSYNPSTNGDKRNDENLLILEDPKIARLFLQQFNISWESARTS